MLALVLRTLPARSSLLLALALGACGGGPGATATTQTSDETGTGATTLAATSTSTATATTTTTFTTGVPTTTGVPQPGTTGTTGAIDPTTDTGTGTTVDLSTSTGDPGGTTSSTGDTTATTASTWDTTGDTTGTTGTPGPLGELSGDCGLIDAMELSSPEPFVFTSAIDFGDVGFDYELLTPGGQKIFDEGNLNPGSLHSEIIAYEVLARCDMAALLKTEDAIVYDDPMGKKTDLLVEFDDLYKIGVSVVRAVGFPKDAPYTVAQAETILNGKLSDILISSQNVAPEDAWTKQILHVIAYGPMHVESLLTAYEGVAADIKADTILVISVTHGDDAFIYM